MKQLVVLAAGRGTRLLPVTRDRSKAMTPVVGRPLVELALTPWVEMGLTDVIFVVGPGDSEIRSYFGDGGRFGIELRYVVQRERKGMAHALETAAPYLTGDFALTACDSLVDGEHVGDLLASHRDGSTVLSLLDVPAELVGKSASVAFDGQRVSRIVEKPGPGDAPSNTVSLPHYLLPFGILKRLSSLEVSPRGEIELQSAIQQLIGEGVRVVGVRASTRTQVSCPEDLRRLNLSRLRAEVSAAHVVAGAIGPDTLIEDPVRVEEDVVVGRDCRIGPGVYLEAGSRLGDGVVISDSVVLRGARVPAHARVEGEIRS